MTRFLKSQSLRELQDFVARIYEGPDNRLYSISDLLAYEQSFTMRALKGIRKDDLKKLRVNLLISFSYVMSIATRIGIDIDSEVWKRFPMVCSYCGRQPCECKKIKLQKRRKITTISSLRPKTLSDFQKMFQAIYPHEKRTLADAGIHLAEETGELSEAVHSYLGQHTKKQFDRIRLELADLLSCIFGVANSADILVGDEFEKLYRNGCQECHRMPCVCTFAYVANIVT